MQLETNTRKTKSKILNSTQMPLIIDSEVDIRSIFKDIRNYLAGMATGHTRDEALLTELIKILFCKIFSERNAKFKSYFSSKNENAAQTAKQINELFAVVCKKFPDVFLGVQKISLDSTSTQYIVSKLENVDLLKVSRDPIGDAFEIFINSSLRGAEGQFFTPKNAIDLLVSLCSPKKSDKILDPACGSGSFLVAAAKSIMEKSGVNQEPLSIYGVDKDTFLSFIGRAHLSLMIDSEAQVACNNSLLNFDRYKVEKLNWFQENSFDLILTNPPYGSDIVVGDDQLKSQFDLAFKWSLNKETQEWGRTSSIQKNPAPQVIFLERCLKLLKPGGRCGVVLPESMFCNPSYSFVTNYLLKNTKIIAVVNFPENLFKTSGKTGTHTKTMGLVFEKLRKNEEVDGEHSVFFADARWCGHDSRGLPIPYDDFPVILENFNKRQPRGKQKFDHLGFYVKQSNIKNGVLIAKYYDPEIEESLADLSKTHELVRFGDFVSKGFVKISTGDEVGKLAYGTGNIPFVRTSDISNWEIKTDAKQGISEEHYSRLSKKQDVKPYDLLMVRDGTYLIGTTAIVTDHDLPLLYQSHIYKIRVLDEKKLNPFLLLAILSCSVVQKQIQAYRFTQDIIDTLGNRINDLILPIPKDEKLKSKVINDVKTAIHARAKAREASRLARLEVIGEEDSRSI